MRYKKPPLSLLKNVAEPENRFNDLAERYRYRLLEGFKSDSIDVECVSTNVSPMNIVFGFKLLNIKRYQEIKNSVESYFGDDAKVFQTGEMVDVFSVSLLKPERSYVSLRKIIESDEFINAESDLTIAVGVEENSRICCVDLKQAPHLLVSGTTGSGKTVFMDDIILSIIYKSDPDLVKLVLVDPSQKDLSLYSGIPHLMFPVITEKPYAVEAAMYLKKLMTILKYMEIIH